MSLIGGQAESRNHLITSVESQRPEPRICGFSGKVKSEEPKGKTKIKPKAEQQRLLIYILHEVKIKSLCFNYPINLKFFLII